MYYSRPDTSPLQSTTVKDNYQPSVSLRPCLCTKCDGKLRLSLNAGDRICYEGRKYIMDYIISPTAYDEDYEEDMYTGEYWPSDNLNIYNI